MTTYRSRGSRLPWAIAAAAILVAGGAVALDLAAGSSPKATGSTHSTGDGSTSSSAAGNGSGSERVVSITPASGASNVAADSSVTVTMSQPVAVGSPNPQLSPAVPGTWALTSPTTFQFTPTDGFIPFEHYSVTVAGGASGVADTQGQHLENPTRTTFQIAQGSVTRLEQLLAALNYLPVGFTPSGKAPPSREMAMDAPGNFTWKWSNPPPQLSSLWLPGITNVVLQGAVMTFEDRWGLTVDGIAGPTVWKTLLSAYQAHSTDAAPYDFVYVQKTPTPETLFLWDNGKEIFTTPVNTGVTGASTPDGTFPVFEHLANATMKGQNLDGTHYDDPNVPFVSYFHGGDALHGYQRASYGVAQSLGCVEMPYAAAQTVFPFTPIGTLVSIQ